MPILFSQVQGMDLICWNLMRQIAGGDTSVYNLWLADSLLDIFIKHRAWLDKFPFLVASVVYTYLRIIEDHFQPNLEKLREKEVKFVVGLLRDRFNDVIVIGRDLARVLQNIARIPEIETVWKDILHNPKALSPSFGGLVNLMQMRPSRRFLQSRITPEMEKKLVFLTSQVSSNISCNLLKRHRLNFSSENNTFVILVTFNETHTCDPKFSNNLFSST